MAAESSIAIADSIDRLVRKADELLDDGIQFTDVFKILGALIREAEIIYGAGQGAVKHELVREVWYRLDDKYKLVDQLDKVVKVPFWLEPFDHMLLKLSIDMLISGIVVLWKTFGWPK